MLSKDWKYLVLLPVTMCLVTACSNNRRGNDPNVSNYTGIWMNETALAAYTRHFNGSQEDLDGFCQAVAADCTTYGLLTSGASDDVVLDAVLIQVNGEVSRYSPSIHTSDVNDPAYQNALHVGHVDNDGTFARTPPGARGRDTHYWGFAGLNGDRDPRFRVAMSNTYFFRDQNSPDRFSVDVVNGGTSNYVRSTDKEMSGYLHRVRQCIPILQQSGVLGNNGGNQSYYNGGYPRPMPSRGGRRMPIVPVPQTPPMGPGQQPMPVGPRGQMPQQLPQGGPQDDGGQQGGDPEGVDQGAPYQPQVGRPLPPGPNQ